MQHIACVNSGLDAVACAFGREIGVFPMVEENTGMCVYGISAAYTRYDSGQDDVVALQSPGGGGWRQLDDARSKMYDFVKNHVIIMMSSFLSPLKIFLLTLCACLFGTTSALASAVGQPLMQLEAEWQTQHRLGIRIRPLFPTGDVFTSQSSCHASCITRHRGRIDFTTEGDAGATCGRDDNTGSGVAAGKAVSWIPSLADEARDYIESVHAHSRQEFPSFYNFFLLVGHIPSNPSCRYWSDVATSDLVAEVLLAVQQQQQLEDEEQEHILGSGFSTEQRLLAFWLKVMPSAESLACDPL
jgi:hypothetical protein